MPVKPDIKKMTATAPQVLNTLRNDIGGEYATAVPEATNTTASIRAIGDVINSYQPYQNAFLHALVNRIGMVLITSKLYSNPWAMFKKGMLEYGETIEEIFVNLVQPHTFDPALAENNIFKREIPDVRAAFHTLNYQKFYKTTVSNDQLRQAFLSWTGITDLIGKIIDALYTSANYDEFIMMKYLIARLLLDGKIAQVPVQALTAENAKSFVTTVKGMSNKLEFMSTAYNMAGVSTYTDKRDQIIILNSEADATIDVEVLASAFNLDKAEFMGQRVLVDSFGALDKDRLTELMNNDPAFKYPTDEEIQILDAIPIVVLDRNFLMIFDNFQNMTEQYNGEGLYWNYWYHTWKTFSASPFNNAIAYTTTPSTINTVTVSPSTTTIHTGSSATFTATVTGTGLFDKTVIWSLNSTTSTVTPDGVVTINAEESNSTLTLTATSKQDSTKKGTATITVEM